jgi:3-hydroxyacyl-CoA dehydrogenase
VSEIVTLTQQEDIAVITLDNPPVNSLSFEVRDALKHKLDQVRQDATYKALVIIGAGRMFSSGADISEFNQSPPPDTPNLPRIIDDLENSLKPVVAAIHGVAAGGGLELTLGCHYRIASPTTRLGLPEVTLGFVPGAGGTQRLPRLVGLERALDMIVSGRLVPAHEALASGVIDEITEDNLGVAAVTFARKLIGKTNAVRRTRDLDAHLGLKKDHSSVIADFRTRMARKARGFEAPYACVECIEAAVTLPFSDGLQKERQIFQKLVTSDQAKAQRHVFFADRRAKKIKDVPKDTPTTVIESAAVIGCGTMGAGIAMTLANAGIPVTVLETSQQSLRKGLDAIHHTYSTTLSKGRLSQTGLDERMARIKPTLHYDDVHDVDIVIEAVYENLEAKRQVFQTLDRTCKPETILATNTSTLNINDLAAVTKRPNKVIGTHFFSPANVMRLMENVRGTETSRETIATVMQLSKRLGKVGVLVGVCDGFVGNRMLYAYRRQADFLLEEGALPVQIDKAIYDFGMPMGPFQMADLAGLDIGWQIRKHQAANRPAHLRYSPIADRICELGRFGQKTKAGWYRYEPASRTPIVDPIIDKLISDVSAELGIVRRMVDDSTIISRCFYPLINEGAKILAEGVALRPSDIDVVWIYGYGFPAYLGGPMFWADRLGLATVYDAMKRLHEEHGEWLEPAPLLQQLAQDGKGFSDLE